jgi:hypothetical protein
MQFFKRILLFSQLFFIINFCNGQEFYGDNILDIPHVIIISGENLSIIEAKNAKVTWKNPFDKTQKWMAATKFLELSSHVAQMPRGENVCLAGKSFFSSRYYYKDEEGLAEREILTKDNLKALSPFYKDFFKSFGVYSNNFDNPRFSLIEKLEFTILRIFKEEGTSDYSIELKPKGNGLAVQERRKRAIRKLVKGEVRIVRSPSASSSERTSPYSDI